MSLSHETSDMSLSHESPYSSRIGSAADSPLVSRTSFHAVSCDFRLSTSPLHRHCYSSQQDELRARLVRTRIAGQVRVRAMQAGQTRSCGARAHTHKLPAHRDACCRLTRNLRSCPTLRLPPPPSQQSFGQLKIVNSVGLFIERTSPLASRPTPQTCLFVCESASFPCARPLLPSSDRSAGQRNQPSHSTVLARPVCLFVCESASFPCARPLLPSSDRSAGQRNQPSHSTVLARPVFLCVRESASLSCARPLLPSSDRSAGQRNQPSHSTVLARPVFLFVCVGAASFPCARPLLPSSDRSAGQRNQPSLSTVLARPVCLFVCVSAASFPCRFPDERTPIEATPLSATSTELGLGWGLGLGLDSLSHSSSHALSVFSPPSFHTLSLSPAFTSVWWSG
jgi:predicted thioesterase